MVDEGELHATWSVSSVSSENEQEQSDTDNYPEPRFGRSQAYKATRVFYRNRRDRPEQEASAKVSSSSDSERRLEDILPTNGKSRTTSDTLQHNNAHIGERNYNKIKSNAYLNYNKSVKTKGDKSAATRDMREKYSQQTRSSAKETTSGKQQRRHATNSRYNDNDNDKSKHQCELREASPKVDRQQHDWTQHDRDDAAADVDNMRYSRNRRSAAKWKLLQLPAPAYNRTRPVDQAPPPADDRRPYRRNLPPRLLAKMKASEAAKDGHVTVASCDGGKNSSSDVQITNTETDDGNEASVSQQHQAAAEAASDESPKVTANIWKERQEFYKSAMPKDADEENIMLQRALEESQRQQEIRELWHTDVLQLNSIEFQDLEREEPDCTSDEVHSLLLDQAEATAQKQNDGTVEKHIFKSSGIESTLSQLDYIARSPHLCQENNPVANAFGLRDLHHAAPGFTNHTTGESSDIDKEFLNVLPSSGVSLFPQGLHCYGSPFQQDTLSLPFHNVYYSTTTTTPHSDTFYTDRNHNTLFPLSSVDQKFDQPSSGTVPALTQNKLQAAVESRMGSTKPYEHFASMKTTDSTKEEPSTLTFTADSNKLDTHHQLFSNDVSSPSLASAYDKDIPDDGSYASSAGTIGETKPIGFVPAIKGATFRSELEAATEADDVGRLAHDIDSRLTTTARVQPSSKLPSHQQAAANNTKAETTDSDVHDSQTADEGKSAKDTAREAPMPGYPGPVPWPIPPYPGGPYPGGPYPGGPFPYPFYPPWTYCPPMPMMPMMPHPMMQMVPVPCWVPPMHPAMRLRLPVAPAQAADATEKPKMASETKP